MDAIPDDKESFAWKALYQSGATVVGGRFIVKFAWSHPAALRLAREIGPDTIISARSPAGLVALLDHAEAAATLGSAPRRPGDPRLRQ